MEAAFRENCDPLRERYSRTITQRTQQDWARQVRLHLRCVVSRGSGRPTAFWQPETVHRQPTLHVWVECAQRVDGRLHETAWEMCSM